jgi:hypothetical protein
MKHRFTGTHTRRRLALPLVGLIAALAAGCERPSSPTDATVDAAATLPAIGRAASNEETAEVGAKLAHLRVATVQFHDFASVRDGGVFAQITGCMSDATLGGMGIHFARGAPFDGVLNEQEPEILLYEPEQNGHMRLVAVEFVIPYEFAPREGPAPTLFNGQAFTQFDEFGLWGLHAWIWKGNPSGTFANFNPTVSCDAVPPAARMTHSGH